MAPSARRRYRGPLRLAAAAAPRCVVLGIGLLAGSCVDAAPPLVPIRTTLHADGPHAQCALRYGARDDAADSLPFPGEWTSTPSWCFRAGAALTLGFELGATDHAAPARSYTLEAHLTRRDAPHTPVWSRLSSDQLYTGAVRVALPPLPPGLGVYTLAIRLTTHGARTHGEPPSHAEVRALTMYGVLDAPQGTTWIGALDVATSWAQGAGSPREAARMLTRALHDRGTYRGGHAYTRDFGRGDRWQQRFYLREFLLDPAFPRGQCDEFSAFLQVLLEASGIADARVQRSGPAEGLGFRTHAIALAGSAELRARLFTYHQYVVSGAEIYDAAVRFAAVDDDTAPLTPARYRERLVDGVLLRSGVLGVWSPSAPFRPVLSAGVQGE
jgi:hypothetical protein